MYKRECMNVNVNIYICIYVCLCVFVCVFCVCVVVGVYLGARVCMCACVLCVFTTRSNSCTWIMCGLIKHEAHNLEAQVIQPATSHEQPRSSCAATACTYRRTTRIYTYASAALRIYAQRRILKGVHRCRQHQALSTHSKHANTRQSEQTNNHA